MGSTKALKKIGVLLTLFSSAAYVNGAVECATVVQLLSACSTFISYGTPDPIPRTPCCDAISGLNALADSNENMQSLCRCLMDLITTYNPNATVISTLPGLCGVSLGFTLDPNTDCNL